MQLKDFSYFLPEELIAQHPRPQRDASRMMRLHRGAKTIEDDLFAALPKYLERGDVLVINDSRVIPARIYGKKPTGAILELLLLTRRGKNDGEELWEALARPAKKTERTRCYRPRTFLRGKGRRPAYGQEMADGLPRKKRF